VIELAGIRYDYPEDRIALQDVSCRIQAGERIVLLGSNGCGKSTLLKILDGLLFPPTGTYRYDGEPITRAALKDRDRQRRFRREVVLLFQQPDAMIFNPTVFDEIAFGLRQLKLGDIDDRVRHWADLLGITSLLALPPFQLSGGEKQKVCLAALLVLEPRVLLLDEPTGNLDPRSTGFLIDFLQEVEATTVVATHNLSLAAELGRRALVLGEDHRLVFSGAMTDLLKDHQTLLAANLLHEHRHRHEGLEHRHYHAHDWD
jgi:cobalt/nickel transport system ATP-binding protein